LAKLPRFTLSYNAQSKQWELKRDGSGEVVKRFKGKTAATKGGVLEKAVGGRGSLSLASPTINHPGRRYHKRSARQRARTVIRRAAQRHVRMRHFHEEVRRETRNRNCARSNGGMGCYLRCLRWRSPSHPLIRSLQGSHDGREIRGLRAPR
jgi:hypothetical protein